MSCIYAIPPFQIVGSIPELGSWNADAAPLLSKLESGGTFTAKIPISISGSAETIEYKLIRKSNDEDVSDALALHNISTASSKGGASSASISPPSTTSWIWQSGANGTLKLAGHPTPLHNGAELPLECLWESKPQGTEEDGDLVINDDEYLAPFRHHLRSR